MPEAYSVTVPTEFYSLKLGSNIVTIVREMLFRKASLYQQEKLFNLCSLRPFFLNCGNGLMLLARSRIGHRFLSMNGRGSWAVARVVATQIRLQWGDRSPRDNCDRGDGYQIVPSEFSAVPTDTNRRRHWL